MSLDVWLTEGDRQVFDANITHNLNTMAKKAYIYYALWRPEEIQVTKAEQLIPWLNKGLRNLQENPEYFRQFNSPNGWGLYENFVHFVDRYREACINFPNSIIHVSR